MKTLIKAALFMAGILLSSGATAQHAAGRDRQRPRSVKLGAEIRKDSLNRKSGRILSEHLIIPRGEWQVGAQVSHVSLSSNNSEYMLLVKNLDANGSITKVTPFVAYAYRDNRSVGLKLQYTSATGNVEKGDLDFLSDDLTFGIEDVRASMNSFQVAIYHRSYIGLDNRGRIGLFSDISLGYTNSRTVFTYNEETSDTYTRSNQLKLGLHPGIVIFAMNNVSTHVSMGIGGVSFNSTRYIKAGEVIGRRSYSKANFKLDVLDISIGVTIHL